MDQSLVAELFVPTTTSHKSSYGSGYLIRQNLILTCFHTVHPKKITESVDNAECDKDCWVRFIGDYKEQREDWIKVGWSVYWESERHDLALLKLQDGRPEFLKSGCPAIKFKCLDSELCGIKATGFPKRTEIEDAGSEPRRNPLQLTGKTSSTSMFKEKYREIIEANYQIADYEEWKGMSGAAVFSNNALVGVIVVTNWGKSTNNLWMKPISDLVDDYDFWQIIGADPNKIFGIEHIQNITEKRRQCSIELDGYLQDLNYKKQLRKVEDCTEKKGTSKIFLLPPNSYSMQKWLTKRLLLKIKNHSECKKISIDANGTWNRNFDRFWFELSRFSENHSNHTPSKECILDDFSKNLQFSTLVVLIYNIDILEDEKINLLITDFWNKLIDRVDRDFPAEFRADCILFLAPKISRGRKPQIQSPYLVKIPYWKAITVQDVEQWSKSTKVKNFLLTYSGQDFSQDFSQFQLPDSPENVLLQICSICDLNFTDDLAVLWGGNS